MPTCCSAQHGHMPTLLMRELCPAVPASPCTGSHLSLAGDGLLLSSDSFAHCLTARLQYDCRRSCRPYAERTTCRCSPHTDGYKQIASCLTICLQCDYRYGLCRQHIRGGKAACSPWSDMYSNKPRRVDVRTTPLRVGDVHIRRSRKSNKLTNNCV